MKVGDIFENRYDYLRTVFEHDPEDSFVTKYRVVKITKCFITVENLKENKITRHKIEVHDDNSRWFYLYGNYHKID